MTDPISQAFAHPEARADAVADRISLRDHVALADIGAFQQERGQTQRLRFNLVVELRPHDGAASDDVDLILSYDKLTDAIATELASERLNLLETLAERVAARILREPQAMRVFLRIEKLDRGPGALGVEIMRARPTDASTTAAVAAPPPHVALRMVFLDPDAPLPPGLLDQPGPLVLTLALPGWSRPAAPPDAAFRIELLAIEQAAWALAAQDPRLRVVATRTEIDWAIRQGNAIIWAPSKLVTDTPGAPLAVGDGLTLAVWLASQLGCAHLTLHAPVTAPADCGVTLVRA